MSAPAETTTAHVVVLGGGPGGYVAALQVDERLATNLANVWAVGDAVGGGRILGVYLLGPHATDLIAEGALAVQLGATADDLAWTAPAHPTLPEAMLEAALGFGGAAFRFHSA
jgi:pyruvate/2-oxoglutarate dehydrogenase complex dihydrolipoamide dehydrogenase (E3) component